MKPTCPERLTPRSTGPIFRELPAPDRAVAEAPQRLPGEFNLPARALWSIDPKPGMVIRCVSGNLWITQTGDARDTVLHAGEMFTPAIKGRVVVQALTDARISISDRDGARALRRA
jgi:hypothetical protein